MKGHQIRFEDYQKATGYQRADRVDYFRQNKSDGPTDLASEANKSESFVSVESYDLVVFRTELNAQKNGDTNPVLTGDNSDELENEILLNGPNQDHDFNESVVIQNVTTIDYSQKMVTTKS